MAAGAEAGAPGEASGRRAAALVASGILASRVAGLVREVLFASLFGTTAFAEAWRAALRIPNVIQNLLGEGTLSASFVPVYAEMLERGETEKAGRFAGAAFGILAATAGLLVAAGSALAPLIVSVLAPGYEGQTRALTIRLLRILFPMVGVLVLSAWALGILNSHRRFFVSYVAPVLWNAAMIATMVALGWIWVTEPDDLIVALGWGALVGGVCQIGVQLPFLAGRLGPFRPSLDLDVPGVRQALRNFVPMVSARGVVNLSALVELQLASLLAAGAVAVLGYAQVLYILPISLFGLSVAAAELPELSRHRNRARNVLAGRISAALERVAYFLIPSVAAYLLFGDLITAAVYQRREFGASDTMATYAVLAAYSVGLFASANSRMLSSAFYAMHDTRTPARIAGLRVAVSLLAGAALMLPLDRLAAGPLRLGGAGIALGTSLAAWLEYALLRVRLARVLGPHGMAPGRMVRLLGAVGIAVAAGKTSELLAGSLPPIPAAAGTLLPFGIAYLASAHAFGVRIGGGRR